ncbi:MAG: hypothetical protein M0R80_08055 [Proteobacteria bacterium]|jgi:hypothetical protein|nr:hypothetical protein [Pseudomonadota bacterium]
MKVNLSDGRIAQIGVQIGEEMPAQPSQRSLREVDSGKKFRSVRLNITVSKDGAVVGQVSGTSYCVPHDQFVRAEGRKRALRRLLKEDAGRKVLSKEDRKILCPIIVQGHNFVIGGRPEPINVLPEFVCQAK